MNDTAQTEDPFVGKTIAGKYKIVRLLGEGGMGCVYVGEQPMGTTVRKVAVKTLHKHLSHDPQIKARFQREVGTVAALEHPNTIQVFDFGETDDGTLYIVMELVQGRSVADWLEKDGPMAPERVERILGQVCGSLEEAHGHGIIHRDLKPDNIVLCERAGQKDWVEVLDFGIAKRSNEQDEREQKLTQQGMVLGTPPYMSPEQFTGNPLDLRSDIYALGVMAYEMLTGRLPFEANTPWEWATQHMTAQPKPIEIQPNGPGIPPKMRAAIMRALSKNRDERPATVKEFFEAFAMGNVDLAPTSMRGPGPSNPNAGGTAAIAAPGPSGPAGEAVSPRGKTEIGAPMPMGGPQGGAYGPPPTPAQQGPSGYVGAPAAPAVVPAAPTQQADSGGGGRGLLIGAIVVVALLTLGGVGAAMYAKGSGRKTPVTPPPTDTTTATVATADPTASGSSATNDTGSSSGDVAPLGSTKPLGSSSAGTAHTGGGTNPTTKPTAKVDAGGVPTLRPPGSLTPETKQACQNAAAAKKAGKWGTEASEGAKCKAGGGSY